MREYENADENDPLEREGKNRKGVFKKKVTWNTEKDFGKKDYFFLCNKREETNY